MGKLKQLMMAASQGAVIVTARDAPAGGLGGRIAAANLSASPTCSQDV